METKRVFHLYYLLLLTSLLLFIISIVMADAPKQEEQGKSSSEGTVQIVYMERSAESDAADPETTHIHTLANVLGSEEAAKNAILYSYKHTVNGFSAKLTPEQVEALSKQPGVVQIIPSRTYKLHGPGLAGI
uniref:TSA: Wollemia nobilis Ref_Wollemi_Transcript_25149_773 transcribed RNA sequence n=1 Tax=Wollemia nobilis TaxID=56998 RepID=A0A0C9S1M3_9CONI